MRQAQFQLRRALRLGGDARHHDRQRCEIKLTQRRRERLSEDLLLRSLVVHHALPDVRRQHKARRVAEQRADPGVQARLDLGAEIGPDAVPTGGEVNLLHHQHDALGVHHAGARRAHDLGIGRARLAIERGQCRAGALVVALDGLEDALGRHNVADRIDQVLQPPEFQLDCAPFSGGRGQRVELVDQGCALRAPAFQQRHAIHDVACGNALAWAAGRIGHRRAQRRELAERQNEARQRDAPIAQAALEAIAQQRRERLPLGHAFDQRQALAHPRRAQVDVERLAFTVAVAQMTAAQQRRR